MDATDEPSDIEDVIAGMIDKLRARAAERAAHRTPEDTHEEEARHTQQLRAERLRRARDAGMPIGDLRRRAMISGATVEDTPALRAARRVIGRYGATRVPGVGGIGTMFVLAGPAGAGKTAALCSAVLDIGVHALFVRAESLPSDLAFWERREELECCTALIIDEVDPSTEKVTDCLRRLWKTRCDNGLLTVASTNMPKSEATSIFLGKDQAALSRALAQGLPGDPNYWFEQVSGEDLRTQTR